MRKSVSILIILLIAAFLSTVGAAASSDDSADAGRTFPKMDFQTPQAPEDRAYLGLPDRDRFSIGEVKADLVVIEILNVYCISCQKQVPLYNKLFEFIQDNADMKDTIKIMAVAAGNDASEIQEFRQSLGVRFPVIPDPDFTTYELLNVGETPYSLFVHPDPFTGMGTIAGTHKGAIFGLKSFVVNLKKMAEAEGPVERSSTESQEGSSLTFESVISKTELEKKLRSIFEKWGDVTAIREYKKQTRFPVYSAGLRTDGKVHEYYAVVVSRPVPCDLCHDVHFVYVFDADGIVVALEPLQLRKYGNEPFSEEDTAKLRSRIVGRPLADLTKFHPEVDAVSSATITCSVLFNSLAKGDALFHAIKDSGGFQAP